MQKRPKLFIGSSGKNLDVANVLHRALQDNVEVTVWPQEIFEPSGFPIETLIREIRNREFAAFVFGLDDKLAATNDHSAQWTTRDNVLIETGMALALLGRDRVFLVMPKSRKTDLKIPSDLHGMTLLLWDDLRSDKNLRAAVDGIAAEMKQRITESKHEPDWVPGEHQKIADNYINSIANFPHTIKEASIPLARTWLQLWRDQVEDLQNDGLVVSHVSTPSRNVRFSAK